MPCWTVWKKVTRVGISTKLPRRLREAGLALQPTFIAFMPWTTIEGYGALLQALADLELVENTAPVQLALRLLITQKSRLLELPDIQAVIGSV